MQDFGLFTISGIIDGINMKQKEIIEIKTRKSFDSNIYTINRRELIKLFCYMKLFDAETCYFVELGPKGDYKTHVIEWNDKFWLNEIYYKLVKFTNELKK